MAQWGEGLRAAEGGAHLKKSRAILKTPAAKRIVLFVFCTTSQTVISQFRP